MHKYAQVCLMIGINQKMDKYCLFLEFYGGRQKELRQNEIRYSKSTFFGILNYKS